MCKFYVIPFSVTTEDEHGWSHVAIFGACDRKTAQGKHFGSFEDYVADGSEDIWGSRIIRDYDGSSFEVSDRGYVYNSRPCDCGDDGCFDEDSNHDSQTVCAQWDAHTEFPEFASIDAAREYIAKSLHRNDTPVVIHDECECDIEDDYEFECSAGSN